MAYVKIKGLPGLPGLEPELLGSGTQPLRVKDLLDLGGLHVVQVKELFVMSKEFLGLALKLTASSRFQAFQVVRDL